MEYGWILLRMIAVLGAVCALAYVSLRWGLKRYTNLQPGAKGQMEVVDRLGIGPRRSVMVIRTGGQYWLLGSSEVGLSMLGELEGWSPGDQECYDDADSDFDSDLDGTVQLSNSSSDSR
jgi:flagellar biosynthetic protein FliO